MLGMETPMTEKPNEKPKLELVDPPITPEGQPPVTSIFDDLEKLRKDSVITVRRKVIKGAITVGKPKNNIYFRCHPTVFLEDMLVVVGPEGSMISTSRSGDEGLLGHKRSGCAKFTIAGVYSWPGGAISFGRSIKSTANAS